MRLRSVESEQETKRGLNLAGCLASRRQNVRSRRSKHVESLAALLACIALGSQNRETLAQPAAAAELDEGYAIIVDAGSSGCRVHVFKLQWDRSGTAMIPHVQLPDHKLKTKPGLSSFRDNAAAAGPSLEGIMKFAMENVPAEYRSKTPIRLAATAGLRMIPVEAANQILESCYQYISTHTPFIVKREKISVISGLDEGAFGWLSVNYLYKRLGGMADEKLGTVGTIEMGGASTQVTSQLPHPPSPEAADKPWLYTLRLGGSVYPLYTHSYLGFGQDAARAAYNAQLSTADDPCFPLNYSKTQPSSNPYLGRDGAVRGTGNFSACRRRIDSELFPPAACAEPPCSFGGVHQPPIWPASSSAGGFVMFENFYHSSKAVGVIGMETGVGVPDFDRAGEEYCRHSWDEIMHRSETGLYPAMQSGDEVKYCFSMAFFSVFLAKGLGVPPSAKFPVVGSVAGVDIDWSLGMMLAEVLPSQPSPPSVPANAPAPPHVPPIAAAAGVPDAAMPLEEAVKAPARASTPTAQATHALPINANTPAPTPPSPIVGGAVAAQTAVAVPASKEIPPSVHVHSAIASAGVPEPAHQAGVAPAALSKTLSPASDAAPVAQGAPAVDIKVDSAMHPLPVTSPTPASADPHVRPPATTALGVVPVPWSHDGPAVQRTRPQATNPISMGAGEVADKPLVVRGGGYKAPIGDAANSAVSGGGAGSDKKIGLVVHTPAGKVEPFWGEDRTVEDAKDGKDDDGVLPVPAPAADSAQSDPALNIVDNNKSSAKNKQQQLQSEFVGPPLLATTAVSQPEFKVGGSERSLVGRGLGLLGGASVVAVVAGLLVMWGRQTARASPAMGPRSSSGVRLADMEEGRRPERYRDKDH